MGAVYSLMDVPAILVFSVTFLLFWHLMGAPKNLPPGPSPWPLIGNIPQMGNPKKIHHALHQFALRYGGIYMLRFGPFRSIVINDIPVSTKCSRNSPV